MKPTTHAFASTLDVGCGGGVYATVARGDINVSMDKPNPVPNYFVIADAHHLPFRDKEFLAVFAFNLLEHVSDPQATLIELKRVGRSVTVRQDRIFNLANYATPEHLWFQLPGLRFLRYPRTPVGILASKMLRQLLTVNIPKLPRKHQVTRVLSLFMPPNQQYQVTIS